MIGFNRQPESAPILKLRRTRLSNSARGERPGVERSSTELIVPGCTKERFLDPNVRVLAYYGPKPASSIRVGTLEDPTKCRGPDSQLLAGLPKNPRKDTHRRDLARGLAYLLKGFRPSTSMSRIAVGVDDYDLAEVQCADLVLDFGPIADDEPGDRMS